MLGDARAWAAEMPPNGSGEQLGGPFLAFGGRHRCLAGARLGYGWTNQGGCSGFWMGGLWASTRHLAGDVSISRLPIALSRAVCALGSNDPLNMDTVEAIQIVQPATLDSLALRMLDCQVFPTFLPGEQLDGSSVLGDAFVQAGTRAIGYLMAASDEEIDAVAMSMHPNHLMFFDLDAAKRREADAVERMATHWLSHLVTERTRQGHLSPLAPIENGRVWNRFPKLREFLTEEGLLRLDPSLKFYPYGVHFDDHVIHYHPWLGMSRSDSPDSDLHAMLCHHATTTDNTVGIAIDGRCFTPISTYRRLELRDFWRGRPFDRDDLDDPYKTGVTVHTAPDLKTTGRTAAACMIAGIQRTEFFWKHKEGIKTFEAEEVMTPERTERGRYLHAEYDLEAKCFRHLDGAVMVYSESDAQKRMTLDCVLPNTPRARVKPKMFRIDGSITIEQWSSALCMFFRGNPLVHEYLAGATGPSVDTIPTAP